MTLFLDFQTSGGLGMEAKKKCEKECEKKTYIIYGKNIRRI